MKLSELVEKQLIVEMATVCPKSAGFGFVIMIYSNDHSPAHAHVLDLNDKDLGRFLLTAQSAPQAYGDVKDYEGDQLDSTIKKKIIEWANKENKQGVKNWIGSKIVWDSFHP